MVKLLARAAWFLWWLAVAYIPVAQYRVYRGYATAIGCPPAGDCYVPGAEHMLGMELLYLASGIRLWPLCLWFIIGQPLALLRTMLLNRKEQASALNRDA